MTRTTSISSYIQVKEEGLLSQRRFQVWEILVERGPLTGAQVSLAVKSRFGSWCQSETIRNRLTELRDLGMVEERGTVPCPTNGREVILWAPLDSLPRKYIKKPVARLVWIDPLMFSVSTVERDGWIPFKEILK